MLQQALAPKQAGTKYHKSDWIKGRNSLCQPIGSSIQTFYYLANPRANPALSKAIELINQTQYPSNNLTLFFCQNATS
jgi:hypothetical protein